MSTREKCINIIYSFDEQQLERIYEMLEDEADTAAYNKAVAERDSWELVPIEEAAAKVGISLERL
ncbi:hypothetical protein FACS189499_03210 [Clostridia bacterium]|nr:hypothetical protein FACS189499_03210 [Clostridia bacterium]